jgi:hypothetical protein
LNGNIFFLHLNKLEHKSIHDTGKFIIITQHVIPKCSHSQLNNNFNRKTANFTVDHEIWCTASQVIALQDSYSYVVVIFNYNGNFCIARKKWLDQANKALYFDPKKNGG